MLRMNSPSECPAKWMTRDPNKGLSTSKSGTEKIAPASREKNQALNNALVRENHKSKRYMHPRVHSSTVYNSQDMEAT